MIVCNSYLLDKVENKMDVLFEMVIDNNGVKSNYYYELTIELLNDNSYENISILSIKPIKNLLDFLYNYGEGFNLKSEKMNYKLTSAIFEKLNSEYISKNDIKVSKDDSLIIRNKKFKFTSLLNSSFAIKDIESDDYLGNKSLLSDFFDDRLRNR